MNSLADQVANGISLEDRLRALNLVRPHERFRSFSERFGWRKGGDESYIAAADITVESDQMLVRPVLMKAIVGFGTTNEKIAQMLSNRQILESAGVKTSELYACEDAVFYERFLPEEVDPVSYFKRSDPRTVDLIRYAAALDALGYTQVARGEAFFRDLLADHTGAYVVDFGSDLGPPKPTQQSDIGYQSLERIAREAGLTSEQQDTLERRYESVRTSIRKMTK